MQNFIQWTSEQPSDAVKSVFSQGGHRLGAFRARPRPSIGEISLGYSEGSGRPVLALVDSNSSREVLAWVATYAAEAFPLSQVLRVLSVEEFELFSSLGVSQMPSDTSVWASVVLGEMLSQGQGASDADKAPISRSLACFSYAFARASILFRNDEEALRTTVERLRSLESDSLFSDRKIGVDTLTSIWRLADESAWDRKDVANAVTAILAYAQDGNPGVADLPELDAWQIDARRMSSGSIEQRVLEFERATRVLVSRVNSPSVYEKVPMYLAAFTFWVGGGTSHISLLEDFAETFPSVYAWLGLYAGLAGKAVWDRRWLRGVSSVERALRMPFTLTDPPSADLCWTEYELIAAQRLPAEWVKELPKLSPKTLTVEVLPGATCQMRLAGTESESQDDRQHAPRVPQGVWIGPEELERLRVATGLLQSLIPRGAAYRQESLFDRNDAKGHASSSEAAAKKRQTGKRSKP